jgi:hypothetical protein
MDIYYNPVGGGNEALDATCKKKKSGRQAGSELKWKSVA